MSVVMIPLTAWISTSWLCELSVWLSTVLPGQVNPKAMGPGTLAQLFIKTLTSPDSRGRLFIHTPSVTEEEEEAGVISSRYELVLCSLQMYRYIWFPLIVYYLNVSMMSHNNNTTLKSPEQNNLCVYEFISECFPVWSITRMSISNTGQ